MRLIIMRRGRKIITKRRKNRRMIIRGTNRITRRIANRKIKRNRRKRKLNNRTRRIKNDEEGK